MRDAHGAYPYHWATVGRAIEPGETAEQAARRELREETGYVVDALHFGAEVTVPLPGGASRPATLFYARYDGAPPIACHEGLRIAFVDPATLSTLLIYPGQRRLIEETLRRSSQ